MREYIYRDGGKFWRELTDMVGFSVLKEEITEEEYNSYKEG